MISQSPIRGVIFDLDDTLYPATAAYTRGANAIVQHLFHLKLTQLSQTELASKYDQSRKIAKSRLPDGHTSSHNRVLYLKVFLEQTLGFCPPKLLVELSQVYDHAMLDGISLSHQDRFYRLKDKLAFSIVTDEVTWTQMKKLCVLDPHGDLFQIVITSEEYGCEKPSEKLFSEALQRMQISAQEAIVVGDNYKKDIVGASQLGIRSWWITESNQKNEPSLANLIGQGSLSEALHWLENKSFKDIK